MKDFALGLALKQREMGHCGQIDVIIQYGMFGLESQTLVTLGLRRREAAVFTGYGNIGDRRAFGSVVVSTS